MNARAQAQIGQLTDTADAVMATAQKAGTISDRSWLAILMSFGIGVLCVVFYWHREDQRSMTELFSTTIKQNTEVLTKVAVSLERLERK